MTSDIDTRRETEATIGAESIRIRGIVQGVGFRPFVYRLARGWNLDGEVRNDLDGVVIRVAGSMESLDGFARELERNAPPLARIDRIVRTPFEGNVPTGFRILDSDVGQSAQQAVPVAPDAAICGDCLAEIRDPDNQRFNYAFTNCTNCGPRFSILERPPYDRPNTTMAAFDMCPRCVAEYIEPSNRRFHAQPNACADCGPTLRLMPAGITGARPIATDDPISTAVERLRAGGIAAIKGIGGYHLACLATDETAVARLRARKRRHEKPFALMARSSDMVARYARLSEQERQLLESVESPIVLLERRPGGDVAPSVAPGQSTLGFMLPYSPLHHLLLDRIDDPLVMTSGNVSDEPQIIKDDDANKKLGGIADLLLVHDREIRNRVDDSVLRVVGGRPRVLRRARGYAPAAIGLPHGFEQAPDVLALGSHLKSTFCLLNGNNAVLSQHLGDLDDPTAFTAFRATLDLYLRLFDRAPSAVAVDLHPDMMSTKLGGEIAEGNGLALHRVQHHHAHAAACLAENGVPMDADPVLSIVLDGLGYGADGDIWGGEFLLADYAGFRRLATFRRCPMPGGEQAVVEPWRMAVSYLLQASALEDLSARHAKLPFFKSLETQPVAALRQVMKSGLNSPYTTSCGRLFDAVAAVVGLRDTVSHEGQAAMELEAVATADTEKGYPFDWRDDGDPGIPAIDPKPMWGRIVADLDRGDPAGAISTRFHLGLADALADAVDRLRERERLPPDQTVALSGGVFQNKRLFELVSARLQARGLPVLSHEHVPTNDGGLALGQAAIAAALSLGKESRCASASRER